MTYCLQISSPFGMLNFHIFIRFISFFKLQTTKFTKIKNWTQHVQIKIIITHSLKSCHYFDVSSHCEYMHLLDFIVSNSIDFFRPIYWLHFLKLMHLGSLEIVLFVLFVLEVKTLVKLQSNLVHFQWIYNGERLIGHYRELPVSRCIYLLVIHNYGRNLSAR